MASDTRAKILEVACRRFSEQGYEGTSLREIAEDLGFTKAALYYHFQSKDQIIQALLAPMEGLVADLLARLTAATDVAGWGDALFWIIDRMHENIDLFLLVERNRAAFDQLEFATQHGTLQKQVDAAVRSISDDIADQIRMVTALSAVTGFDDWAPRLLVETEAGVVQDNLKAVVTDVLRLTPARTTKARATATGRAKAKDKAKA